MKKMKQMSRVVLALVVTVVAVLGEIPVNRTYTDASAAEALTEADFLQAKGRNLRNQNGTGEIVQLRGTNLGGWLTQEFWMTQTAYTDNVTCEADIYETLTARFGEDIMYELVDLYQDNYITEADFDIMASLGMNCVRLPFWWRNIVDENGTPYANWYERIDWTVEMAKERGIYVIIDFHGAPGSQNGSDHSGVDGGDDKQGASEFFWGSNASWNQELYYEIWEMVAERYKDEPAVAGYDLLNEPYCTYRYNSGYSDEELHSLLWGIYDTAYDKIRAIDENHVIIMEATWDPVDLPDPAAYGWENIMYEYHNYLYDDYDNAAGNQITNMENKLSALLEAAYDVPGYMGEFCYFNNLDAWEQGLALLNDSGINWTTWTYKVTSDYGNWGLVNQNTERVNIEEDTEAEIRAVWETVGESWKNAGLCEVASNYFTQDAAANVFGQVEGSTRYESENAVLYGDAVVESQSFYSNGKGVGYLNTAVAAADVAADWSNIRYVDYTITVAEAGTYNITLGYNGNGADGMTMLCKVNDGANQVLTVNNSGGSWDRLWIMTFQVELNAGTNDLKLSGTIINQNSWANQDYIDVAPVVVTPPVLEYQTAVICDASDSVRNGWTRLEAENAVITGGIVTSQSFYSNGQGVGYLNDGIAVADVAANWSNLKYVTFVVNDVPADGIYYMLIQYNGDDDKKILVKTGSITTVLTVPSATAEHSWDIPHAAVMPIWLKAGANTISVSGTVEDINTWMDLDCIDISSTPVEIKDNTSRYEAEYGVIKANREVSVEAQSFYSNGLGAGGLGSNVAFDSIAADLSNIYYIEFPVYAEKTGEYTIKLAFNGNGADMYGVYRVNDGSALRYELPNAGGSWDTMCSTEITVTLDAGMNTVLLSGTATGTWDDWINFDYIDVTPIMIEAPVYTYRYYAQGGQTLSFALHTEEGGDMEIEAGDYILTDAQGVPFTYTGTLAGAAQYTVGNAQVIVDNQGEYPWIHYIYQNGSAGMETFGLLLEKAAEGTSPHLVTIMAYDTTDDVYVLDYGLDVNLTDTAYGNGLFQNDALEIGDVEEQSVKFLGVQAVTEKVDTTAASYMSIYDAGGYGMAAHGQYGNLKVTNEEGVEVTYSLHSFLEGVDRYTYGVQVGEAEGTAQSSLDATPVMEANITIVPATIVYYEDNVASVISGVLTNGSVETEEGADALKQGNGLDMPYGYDAAYENDSTFSGGSYTVLNDTDKFAFTFRGAGFDLLARATDASASVRVMVYSGEEVELKSYTVNGMERIAVVRKEGVETATVLKQEMVNTYFENGTIYQIPVISMDMETPGTYVAVAQYIGGATDQDNTNALYLDGIRIYHPMGSDSSEAVSGEQLALLYNVRDMVLGEGYSLSYDDTDCPVLTDGENVTASLVKLSGNRFDILNGGTVVEGFTGHVTSGDIAQSSNTVTVSSLVNYAVNGPKKELYLSGEEYAWGTVITPADGTADFTDAMVQVGLKAVTESVKVEYRNSAGQWSALNGPGSSNTEGILTTATEMYYPIPLDSLYQVNGVSVLLLRGTEGTLSLTNIKFCGVDFASITGDTIGENVIVYDDDKTPFSILSNGSSKSTTTVTFSVTSEITSFTIAGGTGMSFTYGTGEALPADVKVTARDCGSYCIYVVRMPKVAGTYTITAAGVTGYSSAEFTVE